MAMITIVNGEVVGSRPGPVVTEDDPFGLPDARDYDDNSRRSYGRACRRAAEKFGLSTTDALATGPELAEELAALSKRDLIVTDEDWHELANCGIVRRKDAIFRVLERSGGISPELKDRINNMGFKHSLRIAMFILKHSA